MNSEAIEREVHEAKWRATEYLSPHEYVLSEEYPELYSAVKRCLLDTGYKGRFLDQEYVYANIGAYRYWIVDNVLNRARLDLPGVTETNEG